VGLFWGQRARAQKRFERRFGVDAGVAALGAIALHPFVRGSPRPDNGAFRKLVRMDSYRFALDLRRVKSGDELLALARATARVLRCPRCGRARGGDGARHLRTRYLIARIGPCCEAVPSRKCSMSVAVPPDRDAAGTVADVWAAAGRCERQAVGALHRALVPAPAACRSSEGGRHRPEIDLGLTPVGTGVVRFGTPNGRGRLTPASHACYWHSGSESRLFGSSPSASDLTYLLPYGLVATITRTRSPVDGST
jgi:hypothetical protein